MKTTLTLLALVLTIGQASEPRFRSSVEVVTVDALITREDRPVSGLQASDLELRDNGVLQRLEYRSGLELWTQETRPPTGAPVMLELANLSGGHVFIAQRADQLRATFAAVITQFRSRYFLTYRPQGLDMELATATGN